MGALVRTLLVRGLQAGLLAGLVCFVVATVVGEPQVDHAIAVETAGTAEHDHATGADDTGHAHGDAGALVPRDVQATAGLLVATTVYGVALGGVFALVFAGVHRRVLPWGPRGSALALGVLAFVTLTLLPAVTYPPNPPGVGDGDTVGRRTALWLALLLLSVAGVVLGATVWRRVGARTDGWTGGLAGVAAFALLVGLGAWWLPAPPDAAPAGYPAELLWDFRAAAVATQASLWITLALVFGVLARRALQPSRPAAAGVTPP